MPTPSAGMRFRDRLTEYFPDVLTPNALLLRYEEMAQIAVLSARVATQLKPVCIFRGEPNAFVRWLRAHDVLVIFHAHPWWRGMLEKHAAVLKRHSSKTPLYEHVERLVATFLRVDIPILGFLDELVPGILVP